jgi:hypothetical protein
MLVVAIEGDVELLVSTMKMSISASKSLEAYYSVSWYSLHWVRPSVILRQLRLPGNFLVSSTLERKAVEISKGL